MQVVDVSMTRQGISVGKFSEGNPIVRAAEENTNWYAILALKTALVLLLACFERSRIFDKALIGITSAYLLLILYHFWLL